MYCRYRVHRVAGIAAICIIQQLGLQYRGRRDIRLANGQEQITPIYLALISWYDHELFLDWCTNQTAVRWLVWASSPATGLITVEAVADGS